MCLPTPPSWFSKNSLRYCPKPCSSRKLPESNFFNQITTCDPKVTTHQGIYETLRSHTCSSCSDQRRFHGIFKIREEIFRNLHLNPWQEASVKEAGGIRLISRFPSVSNCLDLYPTSGTVYVKVGSMTWVPHRMIKTWYKPDVFTFHEVFF